MRKKLLSEAQVRRFQSLASIKPLNEMETYNRDDEATNEELYEEEEMEMDADPEMDADEPEMDEADVEMDEELVEKFMDAVGTIQQVADALGGETGGDEMDMDMGGEDEAPMELDAGDEEGPEEPEEEEEEMLQEALRGISYVPSQKEVVKVVAKRVARRLQEAKLAQRKLNRALGKRR